jgi:hypothetical protein
VRPPGFPLSGGLVMMGMPKAGFYTVTDITQFEAGLSPKNFPDISPNISVQKQGRHLEGDTLYDTGKGGSYLAALLMRKKCWTPTITGRRRFLGQICKETRLSGLAA